ncbi:ImmA/IrrE family metallo-endopeptidase [Aurantimonas coralicida]|uniref:ImmA/IrrE family metallo-endopeptidase n=1 Tax=Aurantimonas coralicida TaxID=182270 RepID=UPI00239BBECD|nr:ImmA/IrrE family metallo-endopeptidase [Aurantimonas coralicida]MDE0925061.1 ImmA/IrrE family metallo-endopeptidase [Aurantimonas coralicida]
MTGDQPRPLKEANKLTGMLDAVFGLDRFEKGPVDVERLAVEYSVKTAPATPIHEVIDRDLSGCVGALVYSDTVPRQWGIVCSTGQTPGRRNFTIAHELGHYLLHRVMIEAKDEGGIYCQEESVHRGEGPDIERQADQFAANLLMPLNDCRRLLPARTRPDLDLLGALATRYGVSLTAVILRWLEYTQTRALLVVSNEGFAHWAKASEAAFRSGAYIATRDTVFELPSASTAVTGDHSDEARSGILRPKGCWFGEPVVEMCIRSERYDQEITLLHLDDAGPKWQEEEAVEDAYDRLSR